MIAACGVSLCFAATDPAPETVLVKRGDTQVTVGDFHASLARLADDEQRFAYRTDVHRITSAVSSLYLARVLANEARAAGIDKEPDVQRRLKLAEEQLLTQIHLERLEKSIKVPDYEPRAREVYKADPARFTDPERVQFKHILVSFQGRSQEEARRLAEEARQKLVAGEGFSRIAREYSNDPTLRNNDGVIGPVPYRNLVQELAQGTRTAEIGKPSGLIKSSEGYHVVVVQERLPSAQIPFEKAKKDLIEADEVKYRRGIMEKKLAEITTSKEITLYTDEIASLKTEVDRDKLRRLHEEEAARQVVKKDELLRQQKALEEAAAKKGG
jgi:peptidyl-prolyl cis-trans isomerase C